MRMSAEDLTKVLKDLAMSQADLARYLDVRVETVYRWCKGRHPIGGATARVIDGLVREHACKNAAPVASAQREQTDTDV